VPDVAIENVCVTPISPRKSKWVAGLVKHARRFDLFAPGFDVPCLTVGILLARASQQQLHRFVTSTHGRFRILNPLRMAQELCSWRGRDIVAVPPGQTGLRILDQVQLSARALQPCFDSRIKIAGLRIFEDILWIQGTFVERLKVVAFPNCQAIFDGFFRAPKDLSPLDCPPR
jgi:hypothetical protein